MIVWGHDSHVGRGTVAGPWTDADAMGEYLDRSHGDAYCAIGSEFGRGTVGVIARPGEDEHYDYDTHEVGAPPEGSIPAVFEAAGPESFFLDLGRAADDPAVGEWLDGEPRRHLLPASVPEDDLVASDVVREFDGLLFVSSSTPSEPVVPLFPNKEEREG